jgi:hypothetical protein
MSFKQRVDRTPNITAEYKGHKIDETDITKFLGLHLDSKLTWNNHIDIVCKKLSRFSYALYNLSKRVNKLSVLSAYHAYVTSTLRYGVIFWGNSTDREIAFRAQKKCLRSVCRISPTETCRTHFIELNILTLPCLYIYEVGIYVKSNISQFSVFNSCRQKDKIYTGPFKTALLRKSIFGMAPKIYNKFPKNITTLDDLSEFKKRLYKFLAEKAYYSVGQYLSDTLI